MNVQTMVTDYLKAIGADGLAADGCGCELGHLAPCGHWCPECVPARRTVATESGERWEVVDTIYVTLEPIDGQEG
jgi:hypothetical protein